MNKKSILVSGIQPTGKLHLGNYLGFLKDFIFLQNSGKYECFLFIADLHSLTEKIDPIEKQQQILQTAAEVRALGVGNTKSGVCTFFLQSAVPAHAELTIILNNLVPFPELKRMTQFKSKSKEQSKNINVGLFDYPVLMAADILLYDAECVPIGDDQLQHLELARTLARKFNKNFGKVFIEPKPLLTEIPRVMSLDDPSKKMSKSRPAGCIFLNDPFDIVAKKIKQAVTDSGTEIKYDPKGKPAISNLLLIYSAFTGTPLREIARMYKNRNYSEFKSDLIKILEKIWSDIYTQKELLLAKNKESIKEDLKEGNIKAEKIASEKLLAVKKKIGLIL